MGDPLPSEINQKEWLELTVLMIMAFCVRLFFLAFQGMAAADEAYYIQAGLNILAGKLYPAFGEAEAGQPLFPLFLSLGLKITNDPVLAGRLLSIFISVLTLIPFHLALRSFCTQKEALWSDLVLVLVPFAVRYSVQAMTHSLFNFFLVTLLFLIFKAQKTENLKWGWVSGLAALGVYLTRVEGFVYVFFILTGSIFLPRLGFRFCCYFLLSFILGCLPFWIWLRMVHGSWQLMWIENSGALETFSRHWSNNLNNSFFYFAGERSLIASNSLEARAYFYFRELSKSYALLLPRVLPILIWIACGLGALKIFERTEHRKFIFVLFLFGIFPVLFYPFFGIDPRYLAPSGVFFSMLAGPGIQEICEKIKTKSIGWICFAALLLNFVPGYGQVIAAGRDAPVEAKQMGEWIRRHITEPQVIMGSDKLPCFYAGQICKQFVWMGPTMRELENGISFEDILKGRGVDLILADTRFMSQWTPYRFLLEEKVPPKLKRLTDLTEDGQRIILYQYVPS